MEATSHLCSSSSALFSPLSSKSKQLHTQKRRNLPRFTVSAIKRSDSYEKNYRGQLVDESLIVLRKRIHEMKVIERNYEPPSDWMDWEKQYYTSYHEIICTAVGLLQSQLMNTKPSLVLGILAIITMSVPASTVMILHRFLELANGVIQN